MRKFLLIINCYTCIHIFQLFQSLDEIMSCDDIEKIVTTSHQQPSQTEDTDAKLTIWKLKVLSALICKTYLNPLHEHLTTKAESLTSSNSLYSDPSTRSILKLKRQMAISMSSWYTEYRLSNPPENHRAKRRDFDHPIAVLFGTTPAETKFHHIFELAAGCKF